VATYELRVTRFTTDEREDTLADLAGRAGAGDERAFASLVKQLDSRIRRWAQRLSPDADSADDLAQLTLIRLHERAGQFDRRSRLTSWLYGMMRNLAADTRRADARRMTREQQASLHLVPALPAEADDDADGARLAAILESFHTTLSAREREVFELAELRGMATSDISARLRIAPATVRVLLLRARRKLRARMLRDVTPKEGGSR
jgi:RNA polymerase sigma-70 factor (ECF subfamily)